ncbi:hypothetical protein FHQ18_01210 [Deferribacter autotrophicus]|uniref:Uncharacterized protein n=1 Tax=Deferribacter autotrophicus TaxID=500465 RepID=A0A5A8F5W7_9BACT|nr:hypothetical protein [Deferribacter autotrophicus]KAA0259524.1 hypothetical protein FHQ18_01210 [Deferribacter autotrophicus]
MRKLIIFLALILTVNVQAKTISDKIMDCIIKASNKYTWYREMIISMPVSQRAKLIDGKYKKFAEGICTKKRYRLNLLLTIGDISITPNLFRVFFIRSLLK